MRRSTGLALCLDCFACSSGVSGASCYRKNTALKFPDLTGLCYIYSFNTLNLKTKSSFTVNTEKDNMHAAFPPGNQALKFDTDRKDH